jgi:hypothetical protein
MTRFVDALKPAPFTSGNISGAYGAYIKSDPLILEPTLFTYITKKRTRTPWLRIFANNLMSPNLPNIVGSKINGSDLICAPCTPKYHVHLICSLY